ncbi:hypothetical protein Hdeb2414_s0011g00360001 [Helianthus debilis subsp. tardiflorus]
MSIQIHAAEIFIRIPTDRSNPIHFYSRFTRSQLIFYVLSVTGRSSYWFSFFNPRGIGG